MHQFVKGEMAVLFLKIAVSVIGTVSLLWPMFGHGPLLALDHLASPIHAVSILGLNVNSVLWEKFLLIVAIGGGLAGLLILLETSWIGFAIAGLFWLVSP